MPHRVKERERACVAGEYDKTKGDRRARTALEWAALHITPPSPIPGEMRPMYKTFACHFHASSHVKTFLTPFRMLTNSLIGMGSRREGCSGHFTLLVIRVCVIWTCSRLTAAKERAERRERVKCCKLLLFFSCSAYFRQRLVA